MMSRRISHSRPDARYTRFDREQMRVIGAGGPVEGGLPWQEIRPPQPSTLRKGPRPMVLVRDVLDRKGHDVYKISPDATVYQALEEMADYNIGALLVMDGHKLIGIFSERDYARKVILKGKASRDLKVREIMTEPEYTVGPRAGIQSCMAMMTDKRVRHLPVVEEGKVIGVLSIGDVVKSIIDSQQFEIDQLENYISTAG